MYSKEKQQEHTSQIRRILVMRPDATILGVQDLLQKQRKPLKLDKDYINRLINKLRKERAKRLDHYTVNKVLAEFQDEIKELKKRLWAILNNAGSTPKEKIMAVKELRSSSVDLFDKMFDAGIFEKKLGEVRLGLFDYTKQDENRTNDSDKKVAENDEENKSGPGRNKRE